MVRYEMAIYEYKEFLSLDDVAEYLTDKGVSNFYPLSTYTEKRLNELLSDWIKSEKLQPLYPFSHHIMQYKLDYEYNIDESNVNEFAENILSDFKRIQKGKKIQSKNKAKRIDIGEKFINDYLIFGSTTWEELWIFDETILSPFDWCKFYNDENNKYFWDIVYCDDMPQEYRKFTIFRNRFVFLKSQLDAIFNPNQPNLTDLEQENQRLQARTAELEKQSGDKELTAISKKAVTKLLYALLKEHKYELGAKKGTTNDILENLTAKHGVKITRETIAKWLDEVNNLEK